MPCEHTRALAGAGAIDDNSFLLSCTSALSFDLPILISGWCLVVAHIDTITHTYMYMLHITVYTSSVTYSSTIHMPAEHTHGLTDCCNWRLVCSLDLHIDCYSVDAHASDMHDVHNHFPISFYQHSVWYSLYYFMSCDASIHLSSCFLIQPLNLDFHTLDFFSSFYWVYFLFPFLPLLGCFRSLSIYCVCPLWLPLLTICW